jgi:hypothetical protein
MGFSAPGDARRVIMRATTIFIVFVISQCARAQDSCIDPSTLVASTVGITRYFTDQERPAPSLDGYRATAWFFRNSRYLVSIAHFVDDAPIFPRNEWRMVELQQPNASVRVKARLLSIVKGFPEGLAVLELEEPFPHARPLKLRESPLSKNQPVRSIAYVDGLRLAKGKFSEIMAGGDIPTDHPFAKVPAGSGLFEMWDIREHTNDRNVLDHGASGAPIVDCDGNVTAVTSSILTQGSMYFAGRTISLTTPWGMANNTATLIQPLFDFVPSQETSRR